MRVFLYEAILWTALLGGIGTLATCTKRAGEKDKQAISEWEKGEK
jgi:hypothetical protein